MLDGNVSIYQETKPLPTPHHNFPPTFDGLRQVVSTLLGPDGCPWDREQTFGTLKHLFLEECYELVEAIEEGDDAKIVEEMGDVLFHIAFQSKIAEAGGRFGMGDVCEGVIDKLVRRHPHVFGDDKLADAADAVPRWDALKRAEMKDADRSILDGVPKVMPALAYAQAVQGRAARMGFDWDGADGVLQKAVEELRELEAAQTDSEREGELGDLIFSIVNAARWMGVEAETALRGANRKFYARFIGMERMARERGQDFESLPMSEKEALWEEAKRAESSSASSAAADASPQDAAG